MKYNKYRPYDFSGLGNILAFFYRKGWYSHTLDLLTITMQGGFEAFSGRASETWENRFVVKNCAIPELGVVANSATGETLGEACDTLLRILEAQKTP